MVRTALPRALIAAFAVFLALVSGRPANAQVGLGPPPPDAAQAEGLRLALSRAVDEGLAAPGPADDPAAAAVAYAAAQHGGRLRVARFPGEWAIRPPAYDALADYAAAVRDHRLTAWAAGLAPADRRYAALAKAFARYRAIAAGGGWQPVEIGSPLRTGSAGPRVQALRLRLAVEDGAVAVRGDAYDAELEAAVRRAQARYGLTTDGIAGPKVQAALNVPAAQRLGQIEANLERWRWLERPLPARRIEVNTAAATLTVWDDGKTVMALRIASGKPQTPTPMFADRVTGIVFNPPWNVPASIAANEIWPRIRSDPGYQAEQGFVVMPGGALRQSPGPKAALGLFKFEMTNPFGVYLHDTPNRSVFSWDYRLLSHGCMRVEQPRSLADWLLRDDPTWTASAVDAALSTGVTIRAPLRRPVALLVIYQTAFVGEDGVLQFRDDAYGWDSQLLGLLRETPQ